jgi:16S rRNA (guanine527-N7)-methyltransferase
VARARRVADIGAGYGFPGLVLAAVMHEAHFSLVEVDPVRCDFLTRTIETMGLTNVTVVDSPAEAWHDGIGRMDLVTSRNVAALSTVLEWAAPLLAIGGTALLWARARDAVDEADARAAADATGMRVGEVCPLSKRRHIHSFVKRAETPAQFPRGPKAALLLPIRAEPSELAHVHRGGVSDDSEAIVRSREAKLRRWENVGQAFGEATEAASGSSAQQGATPGVWLKLIRRLRGSASGRTHPAGTGG